MTCVSKCCFSQAVAASCEGVQKKAMKIRVEMHLQTVPCPSQECKNLIVLGRGEWQFDLAWRRSQTWDFLESVFT